MGLLIVPLTLRQANAFVLQHHRHHKPARGCKFSIGCQTTDGVLVGIAIIGRPVSRVLDQQFVAEVTRLATNGHKNACSKLYTAAARIAREMGFHKIQTYILDTEPGTSLKSSGWQYELRSDGGNWNCSSRTQRKTSQPMGAKQRWAKHFKEIP